ncbi:MAG: hypothetical protein LAO51_18975 [Acidobacteriia bacterium]|nr:hypothetical protein [Terriglobia bacterium]
MRSQASLRHVLVAAAILGAFLVGGLADARDLTFDERVEAQRALEEVYWRHRIWPKENPERKPAFDVAVPAPIIRAKVEDALAKSAAVEQVWNRAISHDQLEAELDRIVGHTRDAAFLRELFDALGNDPALIAETLARSTLADRLVRQWYARDGRFHAATRAAADRARASAGDAAAMARNGVPGVTRTWHRAASGAAKEALVDDEWRELEKSLATISTGALGPVREEDDRFVVTAVLNRGPDEMSTETFSWPKRSFDAWWKSTRPSLDPLRSVASGAFTLAALPTAACTADTWSPAMTTAPDARQFHTAVWTGTEMIVWGGTHQSVFQTGARYSPATDTWTPTGIDSNTPTPRAKHTAVWTGTEMIVWGGMGDFFPPLSTGGRYNPATDQWASTSNVNAPSARIFHTMIWSGSEAIVWGGTPGGTPSLATGARYDPATDTWSPTSTGTNLPPARYRHTAIWTGSKMIVWGGATCCTVMNSGGIYDPSTNTWAVTSVAANVPASRSRHVAVWTGSEMIVWGGLSTSDPYYLKTGGRYDPASNTWSATSMGAGVPGPRDDASAVWTGSLMIVWGGFAPAAGGDLNSGGRYAPATDSWLPTRTDASTPVARSYHAAIWDGSEMIVWGGDSETGGRGDGARYDPVTDTWVPTGTGSAPTGRMSHVAVWTGAEMVVWGGSGGLSGEAFNSGGRYDAALDAWSPTSLGDGVPPGLSSSRAVWTGHEMIVWGGTDMAGLVSNAGGMYDPVVDSWTPTPSDATAPLARQAHTTAWTGREMIVWGGTLADGSATGTGASLDPRADTWRPVNTGPTAPSPRHDHVAVFAGGRMVVWGGSPPALDTGGRYDPATDSWSPTFHGGGVPDPLSFAAAISTGAAMIVWGGTTCCVGTPTNIGWRYDVASDTWLPTSRGDLVPEARSLHSLVWTGSDMLLWGGRNYTGTRYNDGRHYDPATDVWTEIPVTPQTPSPRAYQTAVWTGTQMIIWGGEISTSTGGLYCACPNGSHFYRDADGDGYGDPGVSAPSCTGTAPAGYLADATDCNDAASSAHPGGAEVCDGIDNDCNGLVDESASGEDSDGDGIHDLCDNCRYTTNSTQSDFDHDGEGDACDLNDGLIYEWRDDKTSVSWQAEQGPTSWNLYIGDLDVLKATGVYTQAPGSNPLAQRQCGVSTTFADDLADPEVGKASFSLVTGVTAGAEGSLGSSSAGPRSNQNPCP